MYVGIDVGGTKTLVAKLTDGGEIIDSKRFPTDHDYDKFLLDVTANFKSLKIESDFKCAMGIPGLLNREDGIVYSLGNLPWKNKKIKHDVAAIVGQPVLIENDSRLAGLSEAQLVKAKHQNVLFITVSTGIGGAIIRDGRIVEALRDTEMGKMPLFHNGKFQLWENFAGGRTLKDRFGKLAFEITDPAQWKEIGEYVAFGLGPICSVLQPDIIIFGGSVGKQCEHFKKPLQDWLKANLHAVVKQPKEIIAAQRADDAVIYGCYDLAKQTYGDA